MRLEGHEKLCNFYFYTKNQIKESEDDFMINQRILDSIGEIEQISNKL